MDKPAPYASVDHPRRLTVRDFCDEFSDEFDEISGRCIDIGLGSGDVIVEFILPKLNPRATAVCSDISGSMVNFERGKYRDNSRVSFAKLDIETPDLPRDLIEQFDNVTSFDCLHRCQNMRRFKTSLICSNPEELHFWPSLIACFSGFDAYTHLAAVPRYQRYMQAADCFIPVFQHVENPRARLKTLVKDLGFEVLHCSVRETSHIFESQDTFSGFTLALNPFSEHMPPDLKDEFENDLVRESEKRNIIVKKNNAKDEYSVLCVHHLFMVHLMKPLDK